MLKNKKSEAKKPEAKKLEAKKAEAKQPEAKQPKVRVPVWFYACVQIYYIFLYMYLKLVVV